MEKVKLQKHQKRAIDKVRNADAVLVYHGLGSGKTLTALMSGELLGQPVTVVAPAALMHNFEKERKKHKLSVPLETTTYNKPAKKADGILVFDEAHRMGRLESKRSRLAEEIPAKKKIFLTGTPLRNDPSELIPILRGMGVDIPRDKRSFYDKFVETKKVNAPILARLLYGAKPGIEYRAKNLGRLSEMLNGKVDFYMPGKENYPDVHTQIIKVPMGPKQMEAYKMVLKGSPSLAYKIKHGIPPSKAESAKLNAFLSGARQVSNTPRGFMAKEITSADEPKLEHITKEILKHMDGDKNYKGVTYSAYIQSGLEPLAEYLDAKGIPYAFFTGKQTPKEKKRIIEEFNKGNIKQLLLSGAGAEGLDLKGVKLLQIMEPHWNSATLDQVQGRAIRYKSHAHLPKEEQKVIIQKFIAEPRATGILLKKKHKGADEYLEQLSKQKAELNAQFLEALKQASGK